MPRTCSCDQPRPTAPPETRTAPLCALGRDRSAPGRDWTALGRDWSALGHDWTALGHDWSCGARHRGPRRRRSRRWRFLQRMRIPRLVTSRLIAGQRHDQPPLSSPTEQEVADRAGHHISVLAGGSDAHRRGGIRRCASADASRVLKHHDYAPGRVPAGNHCQLPAAPERVIANEPDRRQPGRRGGGGTRRNAWLPDVRRRRRLRAGRSDMSRLELRAAVALSVATTSDASTSTAAAIVTATRRITAQLSCRLPT